MELVVGVYFLSFLPEKRGCRRLGGGVLQLENSKMKGRWGVGEVTTARGIGPCTCIVCLGKSMGNSGCTAVSFHVRPQRRSLKRQLAGRCERLHRQVSIVERLNVELGI